jgi:hypothetical protein
VTFTVPGTAVPGLAVPGVTDPGLPATSTPVPPSGSAVIFELGTPLFSGMSQLATLYYPVPVRATEGGNPYNPTSDTVQFAFMPQATQVPQASDWVSGSWDAVAGGVIYPYLAKCLVGLAGTVNLGAGRYVAYVKITSSPEVAVLIAGYLAVN